MKNKFIVGVILGAAAGAAIALFLSSDKGQEIIGNVKEAAGDAVESAKDKFGSIQNELKKLLGKGKAFVEDVEGKIKDATA